MHKAGGWGGERGVSGVLLAEEAAVGRSRGAQPASLTSLKERNLLSVFSRSSSTHCFLLCSSSFLFSRFCRRQGGRQPRALTVAELVSFAAPAHLRSCLVAVETYQVDVMMLVEEDGALLGGKLLLLIGLDALILNPQM